MSWSTSGLRVRLAPWNRFKPSSKIFYWPFQGGTSFVDHSCYFWLVFAMLSCTSVYWCLVVTCWEMADLLALVCDVWLWVCYFPICILGRCGTWLYRFLKFAFFLTLFSSEKTVDHDHMKNDGIWSESWLFSTRQLKYLLTAKWFVITWVLMFYLFIKQVGEKR